MEKLCRAKVTTLLKQDYLTQYKHGFHWSHNATTCLQVVQCVVGAAVRVTLCSTVTLVSAILLAMSLLCKDSLRYCQIETGKIGE